MELFAKRKFEGIIFANENKIFEYQTVNIVRYL